MDLDPASLETYRRKLRYKVCYHLGGFCPDIEDVVQDTLTRCLSAWRAEKIQKPESLGAFLSGICNNVILEYRRRIWRESPDPAPETQSPETAVVAPEAEMIEMREAISAALSEMSERDCQILRRFYLQDQDKEEVCQAIGVSEPQFRVALFRAKERFRKIYTERLKHSVSGAH